MEETILNAGIPDPEKEPPPTVLEAAEPDLSGAPTYVAGAGQDDAGPPQPGGVDEAAASNPLQLAWNAILLRENAFREVAEAESPIRKGLTVLVIVLLIAGVAQAVGGALDVLTTPPLGRIQQVVTEQVTQLPQVRELMSDPQAAAVFHTIMDTAFRVARFASPSWPRAGATLCLTPLLGLVAWAVYGLLTQVSAKLLGGRAAVPQFLGVMALAYAPTLLRVGHLLPGSAVVNGLVSWWVLATSYLAVKTVHDLPWARSLGAVLLPRIVVYVLLFGCALVAAVAGPAIYFGGGN